MNAEYLLEQARKRRDGHTDYLARMTRIMLGKGHVIAMEGGLYLRVTETEEREGGRQAVTDVGVEHTPMRATFLTKEDAEGLAQNVANGAGKQGTAMHISDALREAIDRDVKVIDYLERHIATAQAKNDTTFG